MKRSDAKELVKVTRSTQGIDSSVRKRASKPAEKLAADNARKGKVKDPVVPFDCMDEVLADLQGDTDTVEDKSAEFNSLMEELGYKRKGN